MIKIVKPEDIQKIPDKNIIPYIENIFSNITPPCHPNRSLETVGAIFFLESNLDLLKYSAFGLSSPLCEERFEWILDIENGYCDGCVVINNDFAINIIGKKEFFIWE